MKSACLVDIPNQNKLQLTYCVWVISGFSYLLCACICAGSLQCWLKITISCVLDLEARQPKKDSWPLLELQMQFCDLNT